MGKRVHLVRPHIVVDETRRMVPALWRPVLHWLKVADFMGLEPGERPQAA